MIDKKRAEEILDELARLRGISRDDLDKELEKAAQKPDEPGRPIDALTCTRKLLPRFLAEVASLPGRLFTTLHWWRKHPR